VDDTGKIVPEVSRSCGSSTRWRRWSCPVLSDIELDLQFMVVTLAADRQIRRNASQVGEQFHALRFTAATTAAL
jgi:hypothetical protein